MTLDRLPMRGPLASAKARMRALARDERGVTAIEFGVLALPFFTVIFAILQTAIMFLASQVLDSALEDASRKVTEIEADPNVQLGFIDTEAATWINVEGEATIVRDDVERKRALWLDDLERWFPNGPEDAGVVLIKVRARHIDAWAKDGEWRIDVRD